MLSTSTLQGYRNALADWYNTHFMNGGGGGPGGQTHWNPISDQFCMSVNKILKGYKNTVAERKRDGLMKTFEGKLPLICLSQCIFVCYY
jgi:hypothetical protein